MLWEATGVARMDREDKERALLGGGGAVKTHTYERAPESHFSRANYQSGKAA